MPHSCGSQELQSCPEPRHIEPRVLRLKLAPPGSNHSSQPEWPNSNSSSSTNASFSNSKEAYENPISDNNTNNEHDMKKVKDSSESGGCTWSFLQSLSNISHCNNKAEAESVYVHPKVKCSSSVLSAKSLEMCTESLGCETGSNASESSDDMSLFPLENGTSFMSNNTMQVNTSHVPKRLNRGSKFPPPLTSITDLGGLHVRPHREGGRLILEAVTTTSFQPYFHFHAERSDGRLRLRLFEDVASYCGDEGEEVADDEEEEEEEEEEVVEEEGETLNNEACDKEENGAEEGLENYVASVEDEMGMTKFTTPSTCKESGRNRDIFDGYFELTSVSLCL